MGYSTSDANVAYSEVQWSRYMQYEAWPTVDKTSSGDYVHSQADGIDVTSQESNIVGGWKAQMGEAHFQMECSGKGVCDRTVGVCKCYDGYTGGACQRSESPSLPFSKPTVLRVEETRRVSRLPAHCALCPAPGRALMNPPPRAPALPLPPSPPMQRRARTTAAAMASAALCLRSR